jgi:acetyl-CoA acetyltransferase
MSRAVIVGVGMTHFGKFVERTVEDLGREAVWSALLDSGIDPRRIQAAYSGSVYGGMMTGQRILRDIGLSGIPVFNAENACSSSATAFNQAVIAIQNEIYDAVLIVGVERLTKFGGGAIPLDQEDWNVQQGSIMPAVYAMRAKRYLDTQGVKPSTLAKIAVKNRQHGSLNPHAQLRSVVTVEEVLNSRLIADPLTLFQCCPNGDGAAAVVLVSERVAQTLNKIPVYVKASTIVSGKYEPGITDITSAEITRRGANLAYEQAGIGPEDLNLVETHDAFTIGEMLYYEALGLAKEGDAPRFVEEGITSLTGKIPVNVSGGLLSKGHPLGATGTAQIVEVTQQLRNEAGARQVNNAKVGLCHCTGGGISGMDHGACAIQILSR